MRASTLLSVLFLGAGAFASLEARQNGNSTDPDDVGPTPTSLLQILQTGVPSSILTNPLAQATIKSQLAAGNPPAWFTSLPTDVQSFLRQSATGTNNYYVSATRTSSGSRTTGTGSSSGSGANANGAKPTSSNAASRPTGAVILGALGLVGAMLGL